MIFASNSDNLQMKKSLSSTWPNRYVDCSVMITIWFSKRDTGSSIFFSTLCMTRNGITNVTSAWTSLLKHRKFCDKEMFPPAYRFTYGNQRLAVQQIHVNCVRNKILIAICINSAHLWYFRPVSRIVAIERISDICRIVGVSSNHASDMTFLTDFSSISVHYAPC